MANNKKLKYIYFILPLIFLTSCDDYDKVMNQYDKGNPFAKQMMMGGLNTKSSQLIPSKLINRALNGDEEALQIVLAQIDSLGGYKSRNSVYIHQTPVHVRTSK